MKTSKLVIIAILLGLAVSSAIAFLVPAIVVFTMPPCETKTFEAYGRVLKPLDSILLWSFDLDWIGTGTAHLYIRADISSNVPVILGVGGRYKHSDRTETIFFKPFTRMVDLYSIDLDKGLYLVLLMNPNDVRAIIDGEIELTLCTPGRSWSDLTVLETTASVLTVLTLVLTVVALVGLLIWYIKRHASATTGTSTS